MKNYYNIITVSVRKYSYNNFKFKNILLTEILNKKFPNSLISIALIAVECRTNIFFHFSTLATFTNPMWVFSASEIFWQFVCSHHTFATSLVMSRASTHHWTHSFQERWSQFNGNRKRIFLSHNVFPWKTFCDIDDFKYFNTEDCSTSRTLSTKTYVRHTDAGQFMEPVLIELKRRPSILFKGNYDWIVFKCIR